MKHAIGRPTKYDEHTVVKAQVYLNSCSRMQTQLPTIVGLALHLGVDDETIGLWAKEHEAFSATIKDLKARQQDQLINDGMYGGKEVNSTMAIFLLKANHGMIETSHTDITTNGEALKAPNIVIDTKPIAE